MRIFSRTVLIWGIGVSLIATYILGSFLSVQSPQQDLLFSTRKHGSLPDNRLNILLLYGDDWRHDALGLVDGSIVQTDFLKQLASQGIHYTHAAVTTSLCWVSRATLMTGQYLARHASPRFEDPVWYQKWNETFPALLQQAGYHVGHVGKWHYHNHDEVTKTLDFARIYEGKHWYPPDNVHTTKRNQRDALQFLRQRPRDQPFCLTVAFFAPHAVDHEPEQYFPQPKSMSLYQNITLLPPADMETSWNRMPPFFTDQNYGRQRWRLRFDTADKYDRMLKNYFRLISEVDAACAKIVSELERQEILDQTLIIFTTDNGYFHAEHGLADKWYPHQESIRVPLIVRDPRLPLIRRGQRDDSWILSVDLAPTILGAAGWESVPYQMQGQDIFRLTPRQDWYYEHPVVVNPQSIPASSAVVTHDFKYIYWPDFRQEQLFDLRSDPREQIDVANDPSYSGTLSRLRQRHAELKISIER